MDGKDFDTLARKLGGFASRRQAIAGLAGAALAATGMTAAAKNKKGNKGRIGKDACGGVGCEGALGVCYSGLETLNCGSGGGVCAPCGALVCSPNADFEGGACRAAVTCTATTECQLEDQCVSLGDSRVCGSTGGICNEACVGGQVCTGSGPTALCAAAVTCLATECVRNNLCVLLSDSSVCGENANGTCQPACPAGQICFTGFGDGPENATCVANDATCAQTCAGCCTGPNRSTNCVAGDTTSLCGANGETCKNCEELCGSAGPFNCRANGLCACEGNPPPPPPPPTCGPDNCAGCCKGGACQPGTRKNACGIGGRQCKSCGGKRRCKGPGGQCKKPKNNN